MSFLTKILHALLTLFLLSSLTFFLLRFAPGGPFDTDHVFPIEIQEYILTRYGLNLPLWKQYIHYISQLAIGNLGESFQYLGQPVTEIIIESLPYSLILGSLSLIIAIIIGITLGVLSAIKQNTWLDYSAVFFSIAGMSLPSYLAASILVLIFSVYLGWLPAALWESPISLILPVATLTLRPLAMISRMTRTSVIETLSSDYIRTAYGKGLSHNRVVFKHALPNAVIPVLTLIGPLTAQLLTGSFLVEVVFQLPGLGKHFVSAVINRDYPLVMGLTLFYGTILLLCNQLVDLLYTWFDPRMREHSLK